MSFNDRSSSIVGDGGNIQIQADGMVRFGSDNNLNVLFYRKAVPDPELSMQHGRPMSVSKIYVRIQHPGEKDCNDDPVDNKPWTKQRYARQWEQFERQQDQIPDGSPIDILFPQNPEIGANLHGMGVHTIEQLAALTEHGAQSIGMGVTEWRNKARDFLNKANAHVGLHQWAKEKAVLENKLEVQENQMGQLRSQVDKLLAQLQGVPGAMIPNGVGPQAQGHAASVVVPARPAVDWTVQRSPEQQIEPPLVPRVTANARTAMFDPYASGLQGAQITPVPVTPPQAPGRPRGRPRKTPIASEGNSIMASSADLMGLGVPPAQADRLSNNAYCQCHGLLVRPRVPLP